MTDEELSIIFQPMMNDLDQDFRWMLDNKPLLAHYTSIEVLEKILRNDEILFSNPLFMNDLEELRFGLFQGREAFMTNDAIANICASQDRFTTIQRAFDYYLGQFDTQQALDVYVFCLSQHNVQDEDGRLSMWRAYGAQGNGAALVFNTGFITAKPDSPLIIAKVKYDTGPNRRKWLDQKITQYCAPFVSAQIESDKLHVIAYSMFLFIKIFALTFKHRGFDEEHEWRIIYMPDRDAKGILKDRFSYALGRHGVEPKLKFRIEPLPLEPRETWTFATILERIILGPSVSSPLAQNSVRRMLQTIGKPEYCDKVVASTIPLRPI